MTATKIEVCLHETFPFPKAIPSSCERVDLNCQDMNRHLRDDIMRDIGARNLSIGTE